MMNLYSKKQFSDALQALPVPLSTFIDSKTLGELFVGIQTKHGLTTPEIAVLATVVTATLAGLESETALDTNLHQVMPELSNAATRELAADINDRIFKEARRRVTENVIDQRLMTLNTRSDAPTEEELQRSAEVERLDNLPDDSPELIRIAETEKKEELERLKQLAEENAKLIEEESREQQIPEPLAPDPDAVLEWFQKNPNTPIEEAPFFRERPTPEEELAAEEKLRGIKIPTPTSIPSAKLVQLPAIRDAKEKLKPTAGIAVDGVRVTSIAQTKLQVPSVATRTETVSANPIAKPPVQSVQPPIPPPQKRVDGIDPYREPLD